MDQQIESILKTYIKTAKNRDSKLDYKIERESDILTKIGKIELKYSVKNYDLITDQESKEKIKNAIYDILDKTYCIGKYRLWKYLNHIFDNIKDRYVYDSVVRELIREEKIVEIKKSSDFENTYRYIKGEYEIEKKITWRANVHLALHGSLFRKTKIKNIL